MGTLQANGADMDAGSSTHEQADPHSRGDPRSTNASRVARDPGGIDDESAGRDHP